MHCRRLLLLMLLNASTAWSADFDVDNDGVVAPLTDGLLVLRHFFGFTGTALTEGALRAVVEHYNRIPEDNNRLDQRLRRPGGVLQRLNLSETQKADLVEFLKTLTGSAVYTDPRWSNPFAL